MYNIDLIEESYKKYTKDLNYWLPEGISFVDLKLLNQFDLLHFQPLRAQKDSPLKIFFQIIESPEKITLINEEFVVWIIPQHHHDPAETYILIALNRNDEEPHIESAFIASGIYNTSPLVLRLLENVLLEIHETEIYLSKLENQVN
jgi:hypothetical protein